MAKSSARSQSQHQSHHRAQHHGQRRQHKGIKSTWSEEGEKSADERQADRLLDRQIDVPLYILLALFVSHALSGTSSLSLPYLSTHLPHSLQTLLPAWARQLPILSPFATDLPNASHDSKQPGASYWTTGYAGPFRSDAAGFGHPLTALHNFTRACLGLSYPIAEAKSLEGISALNDDMRFGHSYVDRYPWNSWTSYQLPKKNGLLDGTYTKGAKDLLFVLTGILVFTMVRALAIRYVLVPFGKRVVAREPITSTGNGRSDEADRRKWRKSRRKNVMRFAEQTWSALYYTCSLTFSIYVARSEPYWMKEMLVWQDWPFKELKGMTKLYYLIQCAFSCQQVLVLNVEKRRKDHWQMFTHHIITIMLLLGSYSWHFTPMGNIVLILMDPSDILLSSAKCLRYIGWQTMCDIFFGLFMASWIVTRHVLYAMMLYSCIRHSMKQGAEGKDASMGWTLTSLLLALQCLLLIWLVMILKLAWRVVSGQAAADDRSDDELDDEEEEVPKDAMSPSSPMEQIATSRGNNVASILPPSASQPPVDIPSVSRKTSSKKKPHR